MTTAQQMDPLFLARSYMRRRKFDLCIDICTVMLEKNAFDQSAWFMKAKALTELVYVDEVDADDDGIAELLMDENSIAQVSRPGTSLKRPETGSNTGASTSKGVRPMSQSGRPVSGFLRPGTQSGRPGTMEQALKTPRTSHTARPVTSASGRFVRLGTASMLSEPGGPFINPSQVNLPKYATKPGINRVLFDYFFYHENDVRNSLELASLATQAYKFNNWWWKQQLGKCYYRLGLFRDAEKQFQSALKLQPTVDNYLYLAKVFLRLDQPLAALELFEKGMAEFPGETTLIVGSARVHEGLGEVDKSVREYKKVLQYDASCIEAIACIGTNHFYSDMPEIALRSFRRLLQMGVSNAELYNNIGLCCYHSQQFDMAITCFERALALADKENVADVWYNLGTVAVSIGDLNLAEQAFQLALTSDNNHCEAYNNLAVLVSRQGRNEQARAYYLASIAINPDLYEAHYNLSLLSQQLGDLNTGYREIRKALDIFPQHVDSKNILDNIKQYFTML